MCKICNLEFGALHVPLPPPPLTLVTFDLHRLALGTELLYQRGSGMQNALLSLGGYYRAKTWEATARLGLHAWHVSFLEKASKDVVLMAECDGNLVQVRVQCIGQRTHLSSKY